ncbi:MAG: hypothetical protein WBN83_00755 [Desulfoprunum sp.]|jgi:hypothetical protein|uniref:hypothetical protein n=1 Tax=Desulfoprunum sp. TaxID=2020866 RepID=UPI003C758060
MNCNENKKCHYLVCRSFSLCRHNGSLCIGAKTADDGRGDSEDHHDDPNAYEPGEEDHDDDYRESIGAGPFNVQQPAVSSSAGCDQIADFQSSAAVGSSVIFATL